MTYMNPDREWRLLTTLADGRPKWQTSMELAGQVPRETPTSVAAMLRSLRSQGKVSARIRTGITHEYAITSYGQVRLTAITERAAEPARDEA